MSVAQDSYEAGFSLLDALVAIAITAFVGVAATGTLFMTTRVYEGVRGAAARTAFVMDADRVMRSILDRLAVSSVERYRPSFSGTAEKVALVSTGPEALLSDSVQPMNILIGADGARSTLSLERLDAGLRDIFASAAARLRFDYFGAPVRDQEELWLQSWERRDAMPRALRLTITFETQRSDIELVYRLHPQPLAFCLTEECRRTAGL